MNLIFLYIYQSRDVSRTILTWLRYRSVFITFIVLLIGKNELINCASPEGYNTLLYYNIVLLLRPSVISMSISTGNRELVCVNILSSIFIIIIV